MYAVKISKVGRWLCSGPAEKTERKLALGAAKAEAAALLRAILNILKGVRGLGI